MLRSVTLLIGVSLSAAAWATTGWHHPLYLGNGELWRQRVPVVIRNAGGDDALGQSVTLAIGAGPGQADLASLAAEAIRVCDSGGVEMLYAIADAAGKAVEAGPIPAVGTITIPVECPAGATVTYYVYADNPAAWRVPDYWRSIGKLRNGGVEEGEGDTPDGWVHDTNDETHQTAWVTENPRSGNRCLKTTVAAGAEATWIATRQGNIQIVGGARYVMSAWVKAQDVAGFAGWYIHVGNEDNYMIISPMLDGGGGTYDWKQVRAEFTAPNEANLADLGTVLWGTGTAWFDDVELTCLDEKPPTLTATAGPREHLELREVGRDAPWYSEPGKRFAYRVPLHVTNLSQDTEAGGLVSVRLTGLRARLGRQVDLSRLLVRDEGQAVPSYQLQDTLLFAGAAEPGVRRTYYLYFPTGTSRPETSPTAAPAVANPALPEAYRDAQAIGAGADYAELLDSPRNLVRNPSFELGDRLPEAWPGSAEGELPAGATLGVEEPGLFGQRCVKMTVPADAKTAWTGWRQDVPVQPGRTYLYAAWVKCEDLNGGIQLHAHLRQADGTLCGQGGMTGAGPAISGDTDWTLISGIFRTPADCRIFQVHLTMLATGTAWHDGVLVTEVQAGELGGLENRRDAQPAGLAVWPVNPVVKVFREDLPPDNSPPAALFCARNEAEPLQLAVRSGEAMSAITVSVTPPRNAQGETLANTEVGVVGYVPIDHESSYYSTESPTWRRKFPTTPGACDGWTGWWPDPLLPRDTFDLKAGETQPVWVTVKVPTDARPGDYRGTVAFRQPGKLLRQVPFTVHVWDFALPDQSHVKAIYDCRQGGGIWQVAGLDPQQQRHRFWQFMAEHRVCPDTIHPAPSLRYENGQVIADFAAFDEAAAYYFDVLKFPHAYTPWTFYCFGWGHPPDDRFGEAPYPGERPYEGVDRTQLRPEFKRAYQACLKAYWDHLKEKGWADRVVLYISDEPFDNHDYIRDQMQALCDMIHEVDPAIPIYCSTWHHQPAWDGYLNVWGIGHYGIVPEEKIRELRQGGARVWWTTDGQMCTDTPYCAIERLLPHYCFKYGAEAYEFWGIDWLTYDPYQYGWHSYIRQAGEPGQYSWVRYPNGDGFLAYPGKPIGYPGPVSSIRLEQAREGVEDYEYLYLLQERIAEARAAGRDTAAAERALDQAQDLVSMPSPVGRYSTHILPDPDALFRVRRAVAEAIEALQD
ncbi:MAG: DUF4091 domain-containing protein [Armatimonadetes bacterium]|nr:DUF4091 domain-containing protein [Armatimonadota bacterium]